MSVFTNVVEVSNDPNVTVLNPGLTDSELRATPVPVTIPTPVPVTDNGGSLTVDATDLDIRNLDSAQDSVAVTDGGSSITIDGTVTANAGTGPFPVSDNGGSLTVDGTVSISGTVSTTVGGTALATVTNVSVGAGAAVTLSASNSSKTKVVVFNDQGTLFVKYGSGASSTSFTHKLGASTDLQITGYTGIITAIKSSGTTSVYVTEVGI